MRGLIEICAVIVGVVVLFTVLVLAPLYAGAMAFDKWQCGKYQEATGKPTKFSGAMCFVQDEGKWFAWDEYKNRLVAAGSLK